MTAAGEEREAARLRSLWIPTLGDTAADPEWRALAPGATYKPAGTTELDVPGTIPRTVREATLSGLGTLGATLSGRETAAESTLSGRGTLGAEPTKAKATSKGIELPGIELPGFELGAEIGRGGMGIVFRAHQRSLARDIAIKLVRPEAAQATTKSQFVAEALVNGLLDHPNIVPVHELGTSTQGEVYLAMKLVGGTSWKSLLHPASAAHEQLAAEYDLDRHLTILQSVANALAFAHSKGIVHRDLKPENVMVGAFGEVLVMDWGIAVDVRERPGEDARARHKSTIRSPSGTPSYMPPELAEGKGSDIGPWTDTYLLGAILHELLTGKPPHRGETLLAVLLAASQSAPPVFPRGTPPGLAAICTKALAKAPKDRYGTVAELQAALRDYVKHRESEKIAESAALALGRAEQAGAADEAARTRRYADYAEAIAGYRQALLLWAENPAARQGERAARLSFTGAALQAGDVVLAAAQLEALSASDGDAQALRQRLTAVHASREKARKLARRMRRSLVGGTVLVVVGLAAGLFLLSREQLRSAGMLGDLVAREEALRTRLAVSEVDRRARAVLHGTPEPEVLLLAEGSARANGTLPSELVEIFGELPDQDRALAWSPASGKLLVVDAGGEFLSVLRAGAGGRRVTLRSSGTVTSGALSDDGRFAAVATADAKAMVWSLSDDYESVTAEFALDAPPEALALDAEGRSLATAAGKEARLWEASSGASLGAPIASERAITRLCFRDGALWVVAHEETGTDVLRCDPRSGVVLRRTSMATTP